MKYYLLSNSTEKKEVGTYPQTVATEFMDENGEFEPNSRQNLTEEHFPNFIPSFDFELEKKAKLTDIISTTSITAKGFLMNEKAKNIFSQFNIINHQFYEGTLKNKDNTLPYFWLHLVNNSFEGIDFEKSIFCISNSLGFKTENIIINSFKEFIEKSAAEYIRVEKLFFIKDHPIANIDLFFYPQIHNYLIVSEKLLNKLIELDISGIKYKEAPFFSFQH